MDMKKNSGFTLIEVLIAMMVLAVGLLGLAGLQATGLKNNLSAYNRSQATQLAYDMADRMRANVANAETLDASVYVTTAPADAAIQSACLVVDGGGCSVTAMAENDLYEWNRNINAVLPQGRGTITVIDSIFTIRINWDDNRDGCINPGDTAAGCSDQPDDPNFQMSFQL
jgi:type IV pilus assembly protein PilV